MTERPTAHPAEDYTFRAQRFPLSIPLQYRKSGVLYWQDGKTINISRTGILFQADETIPADFVLDIRVHLPRDAILKCQGPVVRTEESAIAVHIHRYQLLHEQKDNASFTDF
jgi:hypothetical protein